MSGSRLHERGDIYSPEGQSTAAGSQQGHAGEDSNQQRQVCHQFQYFFH